MIEIVSHTGKPVDLHLTEEDRGSPGVRLYVFEQAGRVLFRAWRGGLHGDEMPDPGAALASLRERLAEALS